MRNERSRALTNGHENAGTHGISARKRNRRQRTRRGPRDQPVAITPAVASSAPAIERAAAAHVGLQTATGESAKNRSATRGGRRKERRPGKPQLGPPSPVRELLRRKYLAQLRD
jgi:hypothetical protein